MAPAKLDVLLWQVSHAAVRRDVRGRLARGRRAVVAGGAARCDAGVRERGAGKARRALVAGLARRGRRDVGGRLARGRRAVVARGAARGDAGVIERGTGEAGRALVAGLARRRRRDVSRRLARAVVPLWQEAQPDVMPV